MRKLNAVPKASAKTPVAASSGPKIMDIRFRPEGLKGHRAKLGLSAKNYGKLVGVSTKAIFLWEAGSIRPRQALVAKLAALRGIGKREAERRLALLGISTRGEQRTYRQTAEEFITALVKSRTATTSGQINAAWMKAGRVGMANADLYTMVLAKKLTRVKLLGKRGSEFSVADA